MKIMCYPIDLSPKCGHTSNPIIGTFERRTEIVSNSQMGVLQVV